MLVYLQIEQWFMTKKKEKKEVVSMLFQIPDIYRILFSERKTQNN